MEVVEHMRKFLSKRGKGEKGFTLIELLIVVAILGILAAVIIPNLSTFLKSGTVAAANSEAENVKTASLAYYADFTYWPANSDALASGNYTSGNLKADYTFNINTGFITAAAPADNGGGPWTGIVWDTAPAEGARKWIKAP
jgi:prepilin-type N-terminal cleavage/methylation domain-containing protein